MIVIEAEISHQRCRIEVSGHAGYAPEGYDIYCAGVSALIFTLALHPGVESELTHGHSEVWAEPTEENHTVFAFVYRGLSELSEMYPDYICCRMP